MDRKLRMGMVGGGNDAFIGAVHRMAAQLDGLIELSCGAFSSNPEKSRLSGRKLFLPEHRIYDSYRTMFERESKLPDDERMDFVSIVTPNDQHYPMVSLAVKYRFAVMCEKPLAFSLEQAEQLAREVEASGVTFALTHNYTGYPMVKQARALVAAGELGTIRKVVVDYPQGWLSTAIETSGQKQAAWRMDPKRAGASCCIGDIGTHAENLAEYITGLEIEAVCADLTSFVAGRALEDDASVLLRYRGGARGILHATQIATEEENGLNIRVYGDRGSLEWHQQEPNTLVLRKANQPRQILRAGANYAFLSSAALNGARLPGGHPEGFLEAFANLYRNFALTLISRKVGEPVKPEHLDFPSIRDGVRGMAFIEAVLRSSSSESKWVKLSN